MTREEAQRAVDSAFIGGRLRDACNGHPSAQIPWPHALLHDAANAIESLRAENQRMRSALERIAAGRDCGCRPCTGDCTSRDALLAELDGLRDVARKAVTMEERGR